MSGYELIAALKRLSFDEFHGHVVSDGPVLLRFKGVGSGGNKTVMIVVKSETREETDQR